jgi:hypothetical protein
MHGGSDGAAEDIRARALKEIEDLEPRVGYPDCETDSGARGAFRLVIAWCDEIIAQQKAGGY